MSEVVRDFTKLKANLINAARKFISEVFRVKYIKVTIKWSRHEELGRCSVDFQRNSISFTFRIPLKGMTTEDLAVSCIEAVTSKTQRIFINASIAGFILLTVLWYLLPTQIPESIRGTILFTIFLFTITMIFSAGISILKHEKELKSLKSDYIKLAKSELICMRTYSLLVDLVSWILRECRGKNKVVIDASRIANMIMSQYGSLIRELNLKT